METLMQYIDHYVINARLKPALFAVLPLVVTVVAWLPGTQRLGEISVTIAIAFGVVGFLSNLISNRGNALQEQLFQKWGGAPTTTLLRHRNGCLDDYTRARYHKKLEELIPSLSIPSREEERANPVDADLRYGSAANSLREKTRDRNAFPLVYADNVAYGYARNLLCLRNWGIASSAASVFANLVMLLFLFFLDRQSGITDGAVNQTIGGIAAITIALAMLWIFLAVVNEAFVRGRAIRYARTLLSTCEQLSGERRSCTSQSI